MKLPDEWKIVALEKFVADLQAGVSVNAHDVPVENGEFGVLKVSAVSNGRFFPKQNKRILDEEITRASVRPQLGAILVSRSNTPLLVGDSALVTTTSGNLFLPDKLWQIVFQKNAQVHASWFAKVLQTKKLRTQLIRIATGTSGSMKNISKSAFLALEIPIPPLAEQKQIAVILGVWEVALEKLDALISAKECRKQALMQQLLTGKRRLKSFAKKPWKNLPMGEVLERVFRPAQKGSATSALALVSIRRRCGGLFRRPDVLPSDYKTKDLHQLKSGDFLISKRQVVHGAWSVVEAEFDGTLVSKEYAILVNRAPDKLDMRFFGWLAQTPRLIRLARVASTGVHIEKLIFDPDVFLRETIRVPSDPNEQAKIAEILDTASAEIDLLQKQRAALNLQKRGLMQRLLTGKIRTTP
jgi:type I restriction enzyme S subunit